MFAGEISCCTEVLVHVNDKSGEDTEKHTETEHDEVTDTLLGERRLSSEEGFFSLISKEGGR